MVDHDVHQTDTSATLLRRHSRTLAQSSLRPSAAARRLGAELPANRARRSERDLAMTWHSAPNSGGLFSVVVTLIHHREFAQRAPINDVLVEAVLAQIRIKGMTFLLLPFRAELRKVGEGPA